MNVPDLLTELQRAGIRIWTEGERLCYDAPAGALTPALREELTCRKSEIIGWLSGPSAQLAADHEDIPALPREDPIPLSFAQQRLWFLHRMAPDSPSYNVPALVRLQGKLDHDALRSSLCGLIKRHETLRTAFTSGDAPQQLILPSTSIDLPLVDLSGLPPETREEVARKLADQEVRQPFDLSKPPLFRARLLRIDGENHFLILALHHIITDGWSMGVLLRDLIEMYRACLEKRKAELPPLTIQYADFAVWQRRWLEAGELERQLAYWRERLKDCRALEFPLDHPRPPAQSLRGQRLRADLPASLTSAINTLSLKESTTPFMTMLAAFYVLLLRYTGQEDLLVGTPIANRSHPQTTDLIGFFANSLVLRTDASGDPPFRELLTRVRSAALEAYDHQDLPFERLVEDLNPERDLSRNPVFQIIFAAQNAPMPALDAGDLRLSIGWSDTAASRVDLELHVVEEEGEAYLLAVFDSALLDPVSVRQLLDRYQILLKSAVSDAGRRLSELAWFSEAERRRVVEEWNDTATPYPREATIHGLFEELAAGSPQTTALTFEGRRLIYSDLNAQANRLARFLQSRGLQSGFVAGVCLERSFDLIVALLAILKAGGAYLPLDPDYPAERLGFMIEDAAAAIVITHSSLSDRIPPNGIPFVCVDQSASEIAHELTGNLSIVTSPESLAYLIYTSGSTGHPKGTAIMHRSVVRLVRNTNYITLAPDDVLLQLAPVSFDASTFEIWGSILNGANLAIFPPHTPGLEELGDFLGSHKITTVWLTAALFHEMADRQLESLLAVRRVLTGGDVVSSTHVRKVLARLPPDHLLVNGYGPTENTTFTTFHAMRQGDEIGDSVPIGRPISNTRVYILDPHLQPLPCGVPGELYIAGDGLARGYLNRPDLDRERFLPDPFDPDPNGRLYKTGDRCRWRCDGTIEFLGRTDNQVKIRGFRVELGEIENVLRDHPSVRDAVAALWVGDGSDKRIATYIVPAQGYDSTPAELHEYLASRLPAFLLPAAYSIVDRFPHSPNGKIDRAALPDPAAGRLTKSEYCAPRTPIEEMTAAIWSELLDVDRAGIHDNFFSAGGHSLLAIRLASELHSAFGVDIPLSTLFQKPTIAQLALHIAEQLAIEEGEHAAPAHEQVCK